METLTKREEMIKTVLTLYWGNQLVAVKDELHSKDRTMFYIQDCGYLTAGPVFGSWSDLWDDELFSGAAIDDILGFCLCAKGSSYTRTGLLEVIACIDHGGCPSWFKEEDE